MASGQLAVVGLGPGDGRWLTPEAADALAAADAVDGDGPYLNRVPVRDGQVRHASDNREERARATAAATLRRARRSQSSPAAIPACSPWRLRCARRSTPDRGVQVYAQNMHRRSRRRVHGEVSAPMPIESGVQGVLLGYSERRELFTESGALRR